MNCWICIIAIIPIINAENYIADQNNIKNNTFNYTGLPMTKLFNNYFVNFQNLISVYITNNSLEIIENNAFRSLNNVTTIDFSNNQITSLPVNVFFNTPNLKYLFLDNNNIYILQTGLFTNLMHLKYVNLQRNNISQIKEKCFVNVPSLETINLYYNNLHTLHASFISDLINLKTILLNGNPWNCGPNLCEIMNIVVSKFWEEDFPPYCYSPITLGESWKSVVENSLPAITSDMREDIPTNNVTLYCHVCSNAILSWQRDGENISRNMNINTRTLSYSYLTVSKINIKGYLEGNFSCFVNGNKNNVDYAKIILKPATTGMRIITWILITTILVFVTIYFSFFYTKKRRCGRKQSESMVSL